MEWWSIAIASADSVHRNIAEGYCRRSIREYIYHLYIALASLGESVSGYNATSKPAKFPRTISKSSIHNHSNWKTACCV